MSQSIPNTTINAIVLNGTLSPGLTAPEFIPGAVGPDNSQLYIQSVNVQEGNFALINYKIPSLQTGFTFNGSVTVQGEYVDLTAFWDGVYSLALDQPLQTTLDDLAVAGSAGLTDKFLYIAVDNNIHLGMVMSLTVNVSEFGFNASTLNNGFWFGTTPTSISSHSSVNLAGLTITATDTIDPLTVTIADTTGSLSLVTSEEAAGASGVSITNQTAGHVTTSLQFTGTLAQINAALQGLNYTGEVAGADTITVQATQGGVVGPVIAAGLVTTTAAPGIGTLLSINVGPGETYTGLVLPETGDGVTVTEISTNGVNFVPITANETVSVSGSVFTLSVQSDGDAVVSPITGTQQTLIDDIQAGQSLQDAFYYQLSDGTTQELTLQPDEVILNGAAAPFTSQLVLTPGAVVPIPGLTIDTAVASDEPNDQDVPLTVTIGVVNGGLSLGGTGGVFSQTVTITDTVGDINADLQGLAYSAPGSGGSDPITVTVQDGSQTSTTVAGEIETIGASVNTPVTVPITVFASGQTTSTSLASAGHGTITGVSTDGINFTPVTDADPTTINGQFLSLAISADGNAQFGVNEANYVTESDATNALIDAINDVPAGNSPLSDTFFYQFSDGTVGEVITPLTDIYVPSSPTPPFTGPQIVAPDSSTLIDGMVVDQALVPGQTFLNGLTSSLNQTLSVTIGVFDYSAGQSDGILQIQTPVGATVTNNFSPAITLTGSRAQIEADLQQLTYDSNAVADDSITIQVDDPVTGAALTSPEIVGTVETSLNGTGGFGQSNDFSLGVAPGESFGGQLSGPGDGATITAISNDDVDFIPVNGSTTVTGLNNYLRLTVSPNGSDGLGLINGQSLIDTINADTNPFVPLTDTFYYQLSDETTDQVTWTVTDSSVDEAAVAPYSSPATVDTGSQTNIGGISVTKEPSSAQIADGQTIDNTATVTVALSMFDFNTQTNDGTLSIDAADIGAGGNLANVTQVGDGGISITDTIPAINADLEGLTYNAVATGQDVIILSYADGPFINNGRILGSFDVVSPISCYARGTRIRTDRGEVAVEDLRIGDVVPTVLGCSEEPIVWIGRRRVDCARHPDPKQVWPVRVAAGTFGLGRPHRDLFLSPDHAVFVDDVLIPIRHLINGHSIVQTAVDEVTYYHVELSRHDVVLAEGLPAETFLNTGDRADFERDNGVVRLHPDFGGQPRADAARLWEALGAAPLVTVGAELRATRRSVATNRPPPPGPSPSSPGLSGGPDAARCWFRSPGQAGG